MSTLQRIAALTRADWRTLFAASWLLPVTALRVRCNGVGPVRAAVTRGRVPAPSVGPEVRAQAQAVARMVDIAARRGPYRATCLVRSLVLERLLLRHGIACELRFGVRTDTRDFEAHAWVEAGGVALADPGAQAPGLRVLG